MNITIIELISISIMAVSGIFAAARHIMMYQQSSYYFSRYHTWLKTDKRYKSIFAFLVFVLAVVVMILRIDWLLLIIAILSLFEIKTAFSDYKKAIKKLVFTARIKRLFVTYTLFSAAIILLAVFLDKSFAIWSILLSYDQPITLFISGSLNIPIEKIGAAY